MTAATTTPSTANTIGAGAAAAGALMSVIGSFYSTQSQQSALEAQARIDQINASIAELAARSALVSGQREEQRSRLATGKLKAKQRVGLAANGVDMGYGSAADVLTTTDVLGEIDANTIAANAVYQAWGYRTQGVNYNNSALTKQAQASATSPLMSAAGTALGSAGLVASSWYKLAKTEPADASQSVLGG